MGYFDMPSEAEVQLVVAAAYESVGMPDAMVEISPDRHDPDRPSSEGRGPATLQD